MPKRFILICASTLIMVARIPAHASMGVPQGYPPPGYPPPVLYQVANSASLRLQVTPRDAQVFVDGYSAGIVDDFDGVFQRLMVAPGQHELVIYLPGYQTYRETLYLNPRSSRNVHFTMVPLAAGDGIEPPPVPAGPAVQMPARGLPPQTSQGGALSVHVEPADAGVFIDGEPWHGSQAQNRLSVQLPQGMHHLQIEKAGFQTFAVDFEVKAGQTTSLNVNLMDAR